MRTKISLALATGMATLALSAPAFAQDAERAPFDGFYVGASGGYDVQPNDVGESIQFDRNLDGTFGDTIVTSAGAGAFSPSVAQPGAGFCNGQARLATAARGCVNDRDSYSYSGRVGFDKQMGNIVIGVIGEFGDNNIRDAVSGFSTTPANYVFNREIKYTGNVRLRAGYAANTTLFYATGGGVYARIKNSYSSTNVTNSRVESNRRDNSYGYTVGGGIEQKITPNVSIGLEYLFNHVKDDDYRVRLAGGAANNPFILGGANGTDLKRSFEYFRWHSARAVVNFRF